MVIKVPKKKTTHKHTNTQTHFISGWNYLCSTIIGNATILSLMVDYIGGLISLSFVVSLGLKVGK
jgi:hypothetical protein